MREARLRRERGLLVVGAQHVEQPPHLGERLAPGALDAAQDITRALLLGSEVQAFGAGLDDDRRHGVRDDVVQLACDPRPLLGGRDAGLLDALALERLGERGHPLGVARAGLPQPPGRPGARAHRGEHDRVARLVDEDRADDERQPGERLAAVEVRPGAIGGDEHDDDRRLRFEVVDGQDRQHDRARHRRRDGRQRCDPAPGQRQRQEQRCGHERAGSGLEVAADEFAERDRKQGDRNRDVGSAWTRHRGGR